MNRTTKTVYIALLVFVLSVMLVFSNRGFIIPAYAVTGFQSYTQVNASAGSNDDCTGIAVLPSTGYIIQVCRTPNNTSVIAYTSTGTVIGSSTVTNTLNDRYVCWAITSLSGACMVNTESAATGLIRLEITSLSTVTVSTFTNPCRTGMYTQFGSSVYGFCVTTGTLTTGTVFRVSLSSFTQTATWTGASGSYMMPFMTNSAGTLIYALSLSASTTRLYTFSATSSGAVSLVTTGGNSISSYSGNNHYIHYAYDGTFAGGGYLIYGRGGGVTDEYIAVTSSTLGNPVAMSQVFSDVKGISASAGNYWLFLGENNQIYLYKKQTGFIPPDSFVGIQEVTETYGLHARLGTSDSNTFVISKGVTGGADYWIVATNLHNENDNPILNTGTSGSGINCELPENENILICRLPTSGGLTGTSTLLNQSGTNIACMVGIIPCSQDGSGNFVPDNPDIKTNGIGYLLWVIALGVMIGVFWVASRGDLSSLPTFLWFIGTIGITLVVTVIGWIDPTALIISIIVVIAFAVAKTKGVFGGGGSLMNEQLQ